MKSKRAAVPCARGAFCILSVRCARWRPCLDTGRSLKNIFASIAKRLTRLRPHPLVVKRRGAYFLLDPRNWIDNRLLAGVAFENTQIANARAMIAGKRIDLVIDIGANIGLYAVLLGLMPEVRDVMAFEPVRCNHAQLMANLFLNRLTAKVTTFRLGLGPCQSEVIIHVDPRSTGVSRIDLGTTSRASEAFTESEPIAIARFDDICPLKNRRAFVKIDVEGGAVGVLQGMAQFLQDNQAVLQIELSDAERDGVTHLLAGAGYTKIRDIDADAIFIRD